MNMTGYLTVTILALVASGAIFLAAKLDGVSLKAGAILGVGSFSFIWGVVYFLVISIDESSILSLL